MRFVTSCGLATDAALQRLNTDYTAEILTPALRWAFEHCWEKKRADSQLTRSTYNKWVKNFKRRGHYAPLKVEKDMSVKPWHPLAVELRKRPQGSTFQWIADQVEAQWQEVWGVKPKRLADVVRHYFNEKFSAMDQMKGRYSGSQLRSLKFYQHRTADGLAPADEVHADGWNTHATCPHPVTGEFVTYEIWHFHDVATRYVPKPGIGLTENAEVIAKGVENCIRELGVMVHLQTDSTKVVKGADRFTKAIESLETRLGFTWVHPKEVGNSQANGIAENFNTSWLDKRCRELATYQNPKQMDELTFKRVKKITDKINKAAIAGDLVERDARKREAERMGKGLVFDSFDQARDWFYAICDEFNDRPHSSLKKIACTETGRRRHQTPREALLEHRANGWAGTMLSETELIDEFRPHRRCRVTRETVTPYGGMRYKNSEVLGHWNGKEVIVAYDMEDYSRVWVKDANGELLCEAQFISATGYRTQNAREAGDEKRTLATLKRLEKKREKVLERNPGVVIDHPALGRVIEGEKLVPVQFPQVEREELIRVEWLPKTEEKQATFMDTAMYLGYGQEQDDDAGEVAAG